MGDGWRVAVRIVTRRAQQALTVPVSAVFPWEASWSDATVSASARMGVFVVDGGRAVRLEPGQDGQ